MRYEDPTKKDVYEDDYIGAGLIYEIVGFIEDCKGNPIGTGVTEEETLATIDVMEQFLGTSVATRRKAITSAT